MRMPKDGDVYRLKYNEMSSDRIFVKLVDNELKLVRIYDSTIFPEFPTCRSIAPINIEHLNTIWVLDNSYKIKERLGIK